MPPNKSRLLLGTRLHLGNSTSPPDDIDQKVANFRQFCDACGADGVVAVDAEPRIPEYCLISAVQSAIHAAGLDRRSSQGGRKIEIKIEILPVRPWGKFAPALNALVSFAATGHFDQILFCSAETSATAKAVESLQAAMDTQTTLVCGAVLPGHAYRLGENELGGCTSPWNTLALWNVSKLALTGFQSVSEGLHGDPLIAGVEEVATTAILQKTLGLERALSKLLPIDGVQWKQEFCDPARREWHERKMHSKAERASKQLALLGLAGVVHHF